MTKGLAIEEDTDFLRPPDRRLTAHARSSLTIPALITASADHEILPISHAQHFLFRNLAIAGYTRRSPEPKHVGSPRRLSSRAIQFGAATIESWAGKLPRWSAGLWVGSGTKRNGGVPGSRKLDIESRAGAENERRLDTIEFGKEVDDLASLAALEELDARIVVIRLPDATLGGGENHQ